MIQILYFLKILKLKIYLIQTYSKSHHKKQFQLSNFWKKSSYSKSLVVEPPSAAGPHYEQYAKLSRQALQSLCSWRHINFDRYRPDEWPIQELQELDRRQAAEVAPPEVIAEAQARPAATGEAVWCYLRHLAQ